MALSNEPTRPHILLADDDYVVRAIFGVMLRRENYNVDLAEDGQDVLTMLGKERYDLILMDIMMPRISGIEATRLIREMERTSGVGRVPILALTAFSESQKLEEFVAAGMDGCIHKPIILNEAVDIIRDFLGQNSNSTNVEDEIP